VIRFMNERTNNALCTGWILAGSGDVGGGFRVRYLDVCVNVAAWVVIECSNVACGCGVVILGVDRTGEL